MREHDEVSAVAYMRAFPGEVIVCMDERNTRIVSAVDDKQAAETVFRLENLQALLGRPPRILLAEDDNDVRWALTSLLEIDGFQVCSVSNGLELVEEVSSSCFDDDETNAPDAIVTDVRMPGIYIFKIIEEMRMAGLTTPIVIVSGFDDENVKRRAHELGTRFFSKPVDFSGLEEALLNLIEVNAATRTSTPKIH